MICYSNYAICKKCDVNYHLVNGECIHNPTNAFTKSYMFTLSDHFNSSLFFSDSMFFSKSNKFSNSERFSKSEQFTISEQFSYSQTFSNSNSFSNSEKFTDSKIFSDFDIFTQTPTQSKRNYIKICLLIMTQTFLVVKTVVFSSSFSMSMSQYECTNKNGKLTFCLAGASFVYMLPYIIKSISPSFTYIYLEQEVKYKQKLSNELLIGIVCGPVSVLFAIVGIIIIIKNRTKQNEFSDIWEYSSEIEDQETIQTNVQINDHFDENANFDDQWILFYIHFIENEEENK